jgi:hypothetical protein
MNDGTGFVSSADRLKGERERRIDDGKRALQFYDPYLDDQLRGIIPTDLILFGAESGIGKTERALDIAVQNAIHGHRVDFFALEAEKAEIEMRSKFALLAQLVLDSRNLEGAEDFNYADWRLGRCEGVASHFEDQVNEWLGSRLRNLHTYYKGEVFTPRDLQRLILDRAKSTALFVIDHLHYIDGDDENENRAMSELMNTVRHLAVNTGRPIILVAHLRKADTRAGRLVPTKDDFHGSSNIVKIATRAITMSHASNIEPLHWYQSPTYVSVIKDRLLGSPPWAALTTFDLRRKKYDANYRLGILQKGRTEWKPYGVADAPRWARHHTVAEVTPTAPTAQRTLDV